MTVAIVVVVVVAILLQHKTIFWKHQHTRTIIECHRFVVFAKMGLWVQKVVIFIVLSL